MVISKVKRHGNTLNCHNITVAIIYCKSKRETFYGFKPKNYISIPMKETCENYTFNAFF